MRLPALAFYLILIAVFAITGITMAGKFLADQQKKVTQTQTLLDKIK